jgi:maltose alpha-D-glucosyltransferase/alpha-amylase
MLRSLRECPELGAGDFSLLDAGDEHVLALRYLRGDQTVVTLTNLSSKKCCVDLSSEIDPPRRILEVFANRRYGTTPDKLSDLDLDGFGYRWLRVV